MARGISVHIGVNEVDPQHYSGWSGPLKACENDSDDMFRMAKEYGYDGQLFKTTAATRDTVVNAIQSAADELGSGDMFFLTYAGHGGQVKDIDGDEDDKKDETWCLYDGQLLDDELNVLWAQFKAGVRVLVLSDSCHSGSVSKGGSSSSQTDESDTDATYRFMPRDAAVATIRKNYEFYDNIQLALPDPRPEIAAAVRLFSGCQDNQKSKERNGNGDFTRVVKTLTADGVFAGSYDEFHRAILSSMSENQQPNHFLVGQPDPAYDKQNPFSI